MPDQLWYARRTEALGAGIALSWRRRRVGAALDELLRDPSFGGAASAYRDSLAEQDGAAATCDALEAILSGA